MKGYDSGKHRFRYTIVAKVILAILLSAASIKLGILGGNIFSKWDKGIIEKIDTETYRSNLRFTLPIIGTIYNSGNVGISLSEHAKETLETIFHFDMNNTPTILCFQSPYFRSFYINDYQKQFAEGMDSKPYFYIAETKESEGTGNKGKNEDKHGLNPTSPSSSIFYTANESDRGGTPENNPITINEIAINNNETSYKIDVKEIMSKSLDIEFDKKGPKVLIYHTHTNESYIKDLKDLNKSGIPNRTMDTRYSVVRVGEELAGILRKKYDIEVIHNATVHNYPSDDGCYGRSLNTATNILKSYPSIKIILDIHRDGLGEKKLRLTNKVNNKEAARVMFVVGTDGTGLEHPKWRENLRLAIRLQQKLNDRYPGLTRPIYISHNRYNQHLANGALIIEVGGDGNTIGECLESAKYLAEVIGEIINNK